MLLYGASFRIASMIARVDLREASLAREAVAPGFRTPKPPNLVGRLNRVRSLAEISLPKMAGSRVFWMIIARGSNSDAQFGTTLWRKDHSNCRLFVTAE